MNDDRTRPATTQSIVNAEIDVNSSVGVARNEQGLRISNVVGEEVADIAPFLSNISYPSAGVQAPKEIAEESRTKTGRSYVFTSYNICSPEEYNWERMGFVRYAVWQLEKCPHTNSLHHQGYVECTKPVRFTALKKLFPGGGSRSWFGIRRATKKQARAYCMKSSTRAEGLSDQVGPFEWGFFDEEAEDPKIKGEKSRCAELVSLLKSGKDRRWLMDNEKGHLIQEFHHVLTSYESLMESKEFGFSHQRRINAHHKIFRGVGPFCVFNFIVMRYQNVESSPGRLDAEWLGLHYPHSLTWAYVQAQYRKAILESGIINQKKVDWLLGLLPVIKRWITRTEKIINESVNGYMNESVNKLIMTVDLELVELQDYCKAQINGTHRVLANLQEQLNERREVTANHDLLQSQLDENIELFSGIRRFKISNPEYDVIPQGMNLYNYQVSTDHVDIEKDPRYSDGVDLDEHMSAYKRRDLQ